MNGHLFPPGFKGLGKKQWHCLTVFRPVTASTGRPTEQILRLWRDLMV
jgi:hypothetical protein